MVNILIEGNVDLSIAQPGPILFICLQYNKIDFAKYLLSVGSNVKQRTIFNQSCFYKGNLLKKRDYFVINLFKIFEIFCV